MRLHLRDVECGAHHDYNFDGTAWAHGPCAACRKFEGRDDVTRIWSVDVPFCARCLKTKDRRIKVLNWLEHQSQPGQITEAEREKAADAERHKAAEVEREKAAELWHAFFGAGDDFGKHEIQAAAKEEGVDLKVLREVGERIGVYLEHNGQGEYAYSRAARREAVG